MEVNDLSACIVRIILFSQLRIYSVFYHIFQNHFTHIYMHIYWSYLTKISLIVMLFYKKKKNKKKSRKLEEKKKQICEKQNHF